jgi:hypothetical protein
MMNFCLKPIKPNHESWEVSTIRGQAVRVLALNANLARDKVANATRIPVAVARPKYAKIELPKSPWELPDVTSCEPDASRPPPADHVLTDDGTLLPCK